MAAPPRKRATARKPAAKSTAKAITRKRATGPATRKSAAKKITTREETTETNNVASTSFGTQMAAHRRRLGISQTEFEKRVGIPKARLSRYENGHVSPSLATLTQYSQKMNVTITVTPNGVKIKG